MVNVSNGGYNFDAYNQNQWEKNQSINRNVQLVESTDDVKVEEYDRMKEFSNAVTDFIEGKLDVRCLMEALAQIGAFNFSITTDANGLTTISCNYDGKEYTITTNDLFAQDMASCLYHETNDLGITLDELVGAKPNLNSADPLEVKYSSNFQIPCDFGIGYDAFCQCIDKWCNDSSITKIISNLTLQDQQQLNQLFTDFLNQIQGCQTTEDIKNLNVDTMMQGIIQDMTTLLKNYGIKQSQIDTVNDFAQKYLATSVITDVIDRMPDAQQGSFNSLQQLLSGVNALCLVEHAMITIEGMTTSQTNPTQVGQPMSLNDFINNYKALIKENLNENNVNNRQSYDPSKGYYDDAIIETSYQYNPTTTPPSLDLIMKVYVPVVDKNGDYVRDPNTGMIIYELLEN